MCLSTVSLVYVSKRYKTEIHIISYYTQCDPDGEPVYVRNEMDFSLVSLTDVNQAHRQGVYCVLVYCYCV